MTKMSRMTGMVEMTRITRMTWVNRMTGVTRLIELNYIKCNITRMARVTTCTVQLQYD